MRKKLAVFIFCIFTAALAGAQLRSLANIFPNLEQDIILSILNDSGYVRASQRSSGFFVIGNRANCGLDPQIVNMVIQRNPGYLVESVSIISGSPGRISLLDIYNVLANVRDLAGRQYDSATRGRPTALFEDATRVESERNYNRTIADPPPSLFLPHSETVFIRLKDANFGNVFFRGELAIVQNGLRYTLVNFRNMTYLLIPVIREERFITQLYFEPIQEGVLVYSIAGVDISDFYANMISIPSAVSKRLGVITEWASDGIKRINR